MDTREEAEAYDAMDHADVNESFVERIIELGASEGNFLDLGTGTADIPILLAQHLPKIQIVAIDLSVNMPKISQDPRCRSGVKQSNCIGACGCKIPPVSGPIV